MSGWQLEDIPWKRFDRSAVSADLIPLVKSASLVEANAADYRDYLHKVFAGDERMRVQFSNWAEEEMKHGAALAQWGMRADPEFDFDEVFAQFRDGFRINVESDSSVRGSRTGEMLARCMVETGTNSFYTALASVSDEPVLKYICERIAEDELAHYWLFHRHMSRFLEQEKLTTFDRIRIAFSRVAETEDDELAYAWYAANGCDEPYDRRWHGGAYHSSALAYYSPRVVRGSVEMISDALGVKLRGVFAPLLTAALFTVLRLHRFSSLCQVGYYALVRNLSRKVENSRTAVS